MSATAGWVGSLFLTWCGVPLLIDAIRDRECTLPWSFISIWFAGEVLCLMYAASIESLPLIFNYGINTLLVGALGYYRWEAVR